MADFKVTDSHIAFLGKTYFRKTYFRSGASEVEMGSYGEKKKPIVKVNFLDVQGKVPAEKLKIKRCVTIESD